MAAVIVVPEKRRASTRLREQPATRLRVALSEKPNSSTQERPKQKKAPVKPALPAPTRSELPKITDLLPTKLSDTDPLPTLEGIDEEALANIELRSIADSGVLSASLLRSRQRWVQDFLFEKYWQKAVYKKKKDPAEDKPNAKDTRPLMTKMGTCKMIAEPHTFDVTIFVVRDPNAPQPAGDRQFVQYGTPPSQFSKPPNSNTPMKFATTPSTLNVTPRNINPLPTPPSMAATPTPQQGKPATQNHLKAPIPTPPMGMSKPVYNSPAKPSPTPTPPHPTPATSIVNTTQPLAAGPAPVQSRPSAAPAVPSTLRTSVGADHTSVSRPQPPVAQSKPPLAASTPQSSKKPAAVPQVANDPVIQMLAQRATTDNALKQVMKIVASGKATAKQLDYFQGHIDELTKIVQERQAEEKKRAAAAAQQRQQQQRQQKLLQKIESSITPMAEKSGTPVQHPIAPAHAVPKTSTPKVPIPPSGTRPVYNPPTIIPKPRSVLAPPTHVLLEFGVNHSDRYLFPRNSIVEYEPDGTVRASFFVVKKRADLPSANPLLGKKYVRAKKNVKKGEAKAEEQNATNDKMDVDVPGKTDAEVPGTAVPTKKDAGSPKTDAGSPKKDTSSPKKDAAPNQKDAEVPTKKGADVPASEDGAAKEPEQAQKDVFQPVTISFEQPSDPSVLPLFGRVVAPTAEVVKWMTDVAARCERGATAQLALRLPRGHEKDANAQIVVD